MELRGEAVRVGHMEADKSALATSESDRRQVDGESLQRWAGYEMASRLRYLDPEYLRKRQPSGSPTTPATRALGELPNNRLRLFNWPFRLRRSGS
jgi:hypothetical protein